LRARIEEVWLLSFGGIAAVISGILGAMFPRDEAGVLIRTGGFFTVDYAAVLSGLASGLRLSHDRLPPT
jgi:hypothetical protein